MRAPGASAASPNVGGSNGQLRARNSTRIALAGTDLALVFQKGVDPDFEILDCAEAHAAAIANAAMTG